MTIDEIEDKLRKLAKAAGAEVGRPGIHPVTEAVLADLEIELDQLANDFREALP